MAVKKPLEDLLFLPQTGLPRADGRMYPVGGLQLTEGEIAAAECIAQAQDGREYVPVRLVFSAERAPRGLKELIHMRMAYLCRPV